MQQLTDKDILFHIFLSRISFLSFEEKKFLFNNIDSVDNLSLSSIKDIEKLIDRPFRKAVIWDGNENLRMAKAVLHYCKLLNIQILLHSDSAYPEQLKQISDPPYLLYCKGNVSVLNDKCVSVVGTRRLSQNGKIAAKQFAYDACIDGCNVVSGLASGADGYAHQGAVDAYFDFLEKGADTDKLGKTIAVLPCSIDDVIPAVNKKLAAQILQSGGVLISEYEPKMEMVKWHYVARNRIIAGMAPATVVIEAPAGSGALITADFALENGRDVVFHEACFEELAEVISKKVKADLEVSFAAGKTSKYKLENTPEKYLEAGAPLIKDYKDYCECLKEAPGVRSVNITPLQGELFE